MGEGEAAPAATNSLGAVTPHQLAPVTRAGMRQYMGSLHDQVKHVAEHSTGHLGQHELMTHAPDRTGTIVPDAAWK